MTSTHLTRRLSAPLALVLVLGLAGCGVFGGKDKPSTPTVGNRVPILSKIDTSAKVDPALAGVAVIVPVATENAEWAQAGGTPSKSYGNLALAPNPA
ncbi:MAG: pyrrolo-quinoline quinone, partial [Sphingomonadaceae bacterium]|nr:pyrrolo-quinoline quinone [Sphingomonadaceae bacterium]